MHCMAVFVAEHSSQSTVSQHTKSSTCTQFVWNSFFAIKYDTLETERGIQQFNLYRDH